MIKNDVEPVSYHQQENNASVFSPYILSILLSSIKLKIDGRLGASLLELEFD